VGVVVTARLRPLPIGTHFAVVAALIDALVIGVAAEREAGISGAHDIVATTNHLGVGVGWRSPHKETANQTCRRS
jgi:hypothetical protein